MEFPVEVVIEATPVSQQTDNRARLREWKEFVAEKIRLEHPPGCWAYEGPVVVTIYYFPPTEMEGDIDNIVKPLLDAMNKLVYMDDRQVESVYVRKYEPDRLVKFEAVSERLDTALDMERPILYIRVDLFEE
jgi:Holliday junction resolvase RusA-like endonuclease